MAHEEADEEEEVGVRDIEEKASSVGGFGGDIGVTVAVDASEDLLEWEEKDARDEMGGRRTLCFAPVVGVDWPPPR